MGVARSYAWSEIIPGEPDLDNASVGRRMWKSKEPFLLYIWREGFLFGVIKDDKNISADSDTISLYLANFVGSVVGFLNVLVIRLRSLLLAASLSFESEIV
jgi:hypothetical protein